MPKETGVLYYLSEISPDLIRYLKCQFDNSPTLNFEQMIHRHLTAPQFGSEYSSMLGENLAVQGDVDTKALNFIK